MTTTENWSEIGKTKEIELKTVEPRKHWKRKQTKQNNWNHDWNAGKKLWVNHNQKEKSHINNWFRMGFPIGNNWFQSIVVWNRWMSRFMLNLRNRNNWSNKAQLIKRNLNKVVGWSSVTKWESDELSEPATNPLWSVTIDEPNRKEPVNERRISIKVKTKLKIIVIANWNRIARTLWWWETDGWKSKI